MRKSPESDRLHLIHMRDAAQMAQQFVNNRKREDLDSDRMFQFGLAKALELVGESASHVSDELRAQQTQIPWKKIIGMRHILVHNYWRIDLDIVWETTQADISPLIAQLERLLEPGDKR